MPRRSVSRQGSSGSPYSSGPQTAPSSTASAPATRSLVASGNDFPSTSNAARPNAAVTKVAGSAGRNAAWATEEGNDEAALTAAMAKAFVSDAYREISAENIQIHGGVGFTWEYDCHLYFKRAKSDEAWLGNATFHRERVAGLLDL